MSTVTTLVPFEDVQKLAAATARSGFFQGVETPEKALVLMAIAQAEGCAPIQAMQRYHIIKGKPSKQAWAMLGDFQAAGGKVEWHEHSPERCKATFSHPTGGTVTVDWDKERAREAGLLGNDSWRKYPENMLHARCVSNGVRFVYPAASNGLYTPEETADMDGPFEKLKQAKELNEAAAISATAKEIIKVEPAPKQKERKAEALPPLPEKIATIPASILVAMPGAEELNGVPLDDMRIEQLELLNEAAANLYQRYTKKPDATELGLKWIRALIADTAVRMGHGAEQ
jgi:hypothetical protein